MGVILRGTDGSGDRRVLAVGADHDPGLLGYGRATPVPASYARHDIAVEIQALHGEALPQLDAGLDGCVDEELVQHDAPRAVGV